MLKPQTMILAVVLILLPCICTSSHNAKAGVITYSITDPGIPGWTLNMSFTGNTMTNILTQADVTAWHLQVINANDLSSTRWNFTYSNTNGNILAGLNIDTLTGQLISLHVDRSSTRSFASGAGGADQQYNTLATGYHAIYVGAPSEFGGGNQVWQSNSGSFNGSSPAPVSSVPEPSSAIVWSLMVAGVFGGMTWRNKHKSALTA